MAISLCFTGGFVGLENPTIGWSENCDYISKCQRLLLVGDDYTNCVAAGLVDYQTCTDPDAGKCFPDCDDGSEEFEACSTTCNNTASDCNDEAESDLIDCIIGCIGDPDPDCDIGCSTEFDIQSAACTLAQCECLAPCTLAQNLAADGCINKNNDPVCVATCCTADQSTGVVCAAKCQKVFNDANEQWSTTYTNCAAGCGNGCENPPDEDCLNGCLEAQVLAQLDATQDLALCQIDCINLTDSTKSYCNSDTAGCERKCVSDFDEANYQCWQDNWEDHISGNDDPLNACVEMATDQNQRCNLDCCQNGAGYSEWETDALECNISYGHCENSINAKCDMDCSSLSSAALSSCEAAESSCSSAADKTCQDQWKACWGELQGDPRGCKGCPQPPPFSSMSSSSSSSG